MSTRLVQIPLKVVAFQEVEKNAGGTEGMSTLLYIGNIL